MKLQITRPEQDTIEGYEIVKISQPNTLELSHIVDNSCEVILAADIADSFVPDSLGQVCQALVNKLRLGGEISIGGTDIRFFAKYITNGIINSADACKLVNAAFSMSTSETIVKELEKLNLQILTVHMDGLHYEVKAIRK